MLPLYLHVNKKSEDDDDDDLTNVNAVVTAIALLVLSYRQAPPSVLI